MAMRRRLRAGDVFEVPSRYAGQYVVTHTVIDGGGSDGRGGDFPNGHHVHARRLKDGKWDLRGTKIDFWQDGCFIDMVKPASVVLVDAMEMQFI